MRNTPSQFVVLDRHHPQRAEVEAFIAQVFFERYGAQVTHFAQTLLAWKNAAGQWVAALGYTAAKDSALFVEQYGGGAMESQIGQRLGFPVRRDWLVEVGNLAAIHAGSARQLIAAAIEHLYREGFSWVVFTATRGLLNSFDRLEVKTLSLGLADPARLPDGGRHWGSYYDTHPSIMTGSILLGYVAMRARRLAQRLSPIEVGVAHAALA